MLIAVWIASGLLALVNLAAGAVKLSQSKEKLSGQMAWVNDFSPTQVRLIGAAELLGGIGVIVPVLTGILPILTPIAATGIAILQIGAIVVHLRRGERTIIPNIVILALAVFVAVTRFAGV